jgi:hypothetical protein
VLARGNEESGHVLSLEGSPLTLTATFPAPATTTKTKVKNEEGEEAVHMRVCMYACLHAVRTSEWDARLTLLDIGPLSSSFTHTHNTQNPQQPRARKGKKGRLRHRQRQEEAEESGGEAESGPEDEQQRAVTASFPLANISLGRDEARFLPAPNAPNTEDENEAEPVTYDDSFFLSYALMTRVRFDIPPAPGHASLSFSLSEPALLHLLRKRAGLPRRQKQQPAAPPRKRLKKAQKEEDDNNDHDDAPATLTVLFPSSHAAAAARTFLEARIDPHQLLPASVPPPAPPVIWVSGNSGTAGGKAALAAASPLSETTGEGKASGAFCVSVCVCVRACVCLGEGGGGMMGQVSKWALRHIVYHLNPLTTTTITPTPPPQYTHTHNPSGLHARPRPDRRGALAPRPAPGLPRRRRRPGRPPAAGACLRACVHAWD